MLSNPAIDIVIGLVFIYLLYSLLASIIQEIVAHFAQLRGQTLEYAITRMLDDGEPNRNVIVATLIRFFLTFLPPVKWVYDEITKHVVNKRTKQQLKVLANKEQIRSGGSENLKVITPRDGFFRMPSIKYLREDTLYNKPSYISASNFSETVINMLLGGTQPANENRIELIKKNLSYDIGYKIQIGWQAYRIAFSPETQHHLNNLLNHAQGDYDRFQKNLEDWFNDTMNRAEGWYKRKVQGLLLIIGLGIAAAFNVDSIEIAKRLHDSPEARKQLVALAGNYKKYEDYVRSLQDTQKAENLQNEHDSLLKETRELLEADINEANTILGLGWAYDTTWKNTLEIRKAYKDSLHDSDSIRAIAGASGIDSIDLAIERQKEGLNYTTKRYLPQGNTPTTWIGWLITALAISLGAPFWFDLLNKVMQLRGSKKPEKERKAGRSSSAGTTNDKPTRG